MKKTIKCFIISIIIMNFSLFCYGQELRLTNGEWTPYHSRNLKHGGIVSHLVSDIFASKGVKVKYGWFPWARAVKLAETGEWDGCVSWARMPGKKNILYFSDPLYEGQWVFFHLKSTDFNWKKLEDLYGVKLGLTIGYEDSYGDDFLDAVAKKKIPVDYARSDELNFKKLLRGRIQLFLLDKEVGYDMIRTMIKKGELTKKQADLITHHPLPFLTLSQYLILSKKVPHNKKLIKLFNEGLKKFKEAGKIEKYFEMGRKGWYEQKLKQKLSDNKKKSKEN